MKDPKRTLWRLLLIAVCCFGARPVAAADLKQHETELAAGAKAEGKLVLYSSPSQQDAFFFLGEFRKQYPFLQTDLYRATSERLITRILTEARGGKVGADAVLSDAWDLGVLRDKGILAPYQSPQADAYPQNFREKNNYWTPVFLLSRVMAYNTREVSAAEAPKRYEDLLAPKFKGRLGMNSEEFELVANLLKIMGEEKGMAFLKALAKQSISFHTGKTLLAELLSAGEVAAVVNVNAHQIEALKRKGAPVEWVRAPFVIVSQDPIALAAGASHPSAGKLFIDWLASPAGQVAVRTVNRIPAHPQVEANPPGLTRGVNLIPSDPELAKDINHYVGVYRSVFGH
jgi:iron(III) transport system substrate-binding protein